jgi:S1 RNA binding domain protein
VPEDERDPDPSPSPDTVQPPAGSLSEKPEEPVDAALSPAVPESAPAKPPARPRDDRAGQAPEAAPEAPAEAPAGGTEPVRLAAKGEIVEATVRRIAPFGAFVRLADGRKGLIHISQVADEFVDDIKQHLEVGQVVRARITAVAEDGKVDLSIKKAKPRPKPTRPPKPKRRERPERDQAEAKPPGKAESFHVNPLSDLLMDVEKKLK